MHSRMRFDASLFWCARCYVKRTRLPASYGVWLLAPGFTRRFARPCGHRRCL